jgi:hypothetical protein
MARNNRSSYSTSSRRQSAPSFNQYDPPNYFRQQKRAMATTAAVPRPQAPTAPQVVHVSASQGPGLMATIAANAASIALVSI